MESIDITKERSGILLVAKFRPKNKMPEAARIGLGLENPRLAVEDFRDKLIDRFGDQIQSMTLFGSVARKKYPLDSDIDVLINQDAFYQGYIKRWCDGLWKRY